MNEFSRHSLYYHPWGDITEQQAADERRKRQGQLSAITREQWTDLLEYNCIENGPLADLLSRISNCTFPDKMLLFRRYGLGETYAQVGATIQGKSKPQRLGISQERVRQLTAKAWRLIFRDESMESMIANIPYSRKKVPQSRLNIILPDRSHPSRKVSSLVDSRLGFVADPR
jgi:hypothetical protein